MQVQDKYNIKKKTFLLEQTEFFLQSFITIEYKSRRDHVKFSNYLCSLSCSC